mmetsp:Transcript_23248/g.53816  ORF Transcript_23248/g.53816 Transcript_23248/m.53816 type:complete len:214 (-) Transcript_23248:1507-2148(-)
MAARVVGSAPGCTAARAARRLHSSLRTRSQHAPPSRPVPRRRSRRGSEMWETPTPRRPCSRASGPVRPPTTEPGSRRGLASLRAPGSRAPGSRSHSQGVLASCAGGQGPGLTVGTLRGSARATPRPPRLPNPRRPTPKPGLRCWPGPASLPPPDSLARTAAIPRTRAWCRDRSRASGRQESDSPRTPAGRSRSRNRRWSRIHLQLPRTRSRSP